MPSHCPQKRMRICIVTPGQVGSNPRMLKEAWALHDAGNDVNVIATRIRGRLEVKDYSSIPWHPKLVDLRSNWRWRGYRAFQLACRSIARTTGSAGFTDRGHSAFTIPLMAASLRAPADLYIAHYPPALPAAAAAAKRHNARYAYDAEDFHLGDWPDDPKFDSERRLVRSIEGRYLPGCAFVTAASPMIADALAEAYSIARPCVVLNVFPKCQAPVAPALKGSAAPGPSLYWFSQTIGQDRGLECAVRAIGIARMAPHLYLRGVLAAGYGQTLEKLAREAGVGGRVHVLPPAASEDMERLAAAYDLGLCAEPGHTKNNRRALSNKLFSFLLAGLPPVMSKTPAQLRFAEEAGLADLVYPINDVPSLAAILDRYLSNPHLLAATRANVWRMGQETLNWDVECKKLINLTSGVR